MPNITEIMSLCEFSSRSSAFYVVEQLVKEGVVEKDKSGKLLPARRLHEVRVLGKIRAGFAAPAEEELADTITVGEYLIRDKNASFLLQVEGDSMEDAGIHEGDMVIFERGSDCRPGDIVIALTEDGYTIKYLRKKNGKHYLEAANPNYPNIYPKEGEILGVVTGSFRKYK
ncbi:MAG: polymerase subunit [Candidatus Adlerbacteria bacterium]|nr:polymerase subunit [Candidatus Adlerbacteria bacterium]